jgi:hypothetical protein
MPSDPAEGLSFKIVPLGEAHELSPFCCGVQDLDEFLQNDSRRYVEKSIAKVYVAVDQASARVLGYVALVADSLVLETAEKKKLKLKSRDPKYVPAVKVGRLGVCTDVHKKGIATELLRFSVDLANHASYYVGCRLLTLDSLPSSESFYRRLGFQRNKAANKPRKSDKAKGKATKAGTISFRLDLRDPQLPEWLALPS